MALGSKLNETVLDLLVKAEAPIHEERVRDLACERHPGQVNLVMVRASLQHLARNSVIRELSKGVWGVVASRNGSPPQPAQPRVAPGGRNLAALAPRADPVPVRNGAGRHADPSQDVVITAPIDARLVVQAGPGYGKTDVACARVAGLTAQGIAASRILLLSFTRTAVREMRQRIRALAATGVDIAGVEIRTLDSFAWQIRAAFVERGGAAGARGFDQSISDVVELLSGELGADRLLEVRNELSRFQHVFVDEAQDLVGARVNLVGLLLQALPPDAGWTVFFDSAQAIYGWAEDGDEEAEPSATLPEFLDKAGTRYQGKELTRLHRTSSKALVDLLAISRRIATDGTLPDPAQLLRRKLLGLAGPEVLDLKRYELAKTVEGLGRRGTRTEVPGGPEKSPAVPH